MKHITRTMMVGVGLSVAAVATSPMSSSAWPHKEFSISNTAAPVALALNEDQFKGNWKQFKGELKKKWATSRTTIFCISRGVATSLREKFRSATAIERKR